MAKKPILTDDELDGGLPASDNKTTAVPPPPIPPPLPPSAGGAATRPVDAGDTPPPPPPPPQPPVGATRPLKLEPETPDSSGAAMKGSETSGGEKSGRDASGHARPKTRIHGYGGPARDEADIAVTEAAEPVAPCVGWMVVTAGPGRGASLPLISGMNTIGRGEENALSLDFGDDTISRDPHAFVAYDDETRKFHIGQHGKTNLVRLNDAPVLSTETLDSGSVIRIGATTLRFVALCGPDFDWADT